MKKTKTAEEIMFAECLAGRVRVLNRVITKIYDDAARPLGVRVSQMNILVTVAVLGPIRAVDVCKRLQLDKSTMSRDLERMIENKWITSTPGEGRANLLEATRRGRALIRLTLPAWRKAQAQAVELLGVETIAGIQSAIAGLRPENLDSD